MIRAVVPAWGELAWLAGPCLRSLWRRWRRCPATVMTDRPEHVPEGADVYPLPKGFDGTRFSDEYIACLGGIQERVVFALCCDTFLLDDAPGIDEAAGYFAERPRTVQVTVEHAESLELEDHRRHVEHWRGHEIVECAKWDHCSLIAGVFLKDSLVDRVLLLNVLQPGWTLVECENQGSIKVRAMPHLRSVALWPGLFRTAELSCRAAGKQFYWHLDFLGRKDRKLVLDAAPEGIKWNP